MHSKIIKVTGNRANSNGLLISAHSMDTETTDLYVPAGRALLIKFFGIPDSRCAQIVELLYAMGAMPHASPDCCGGCITVDTRHIIAARVVKCPASCEPMQITACLPNLLLITPGVYRVEIPVQWVGSVNISMTELALDMVHPQMTGMRV